MSNYDANIVSRVMDAFTWEMTTGDVIEGVLDHFNVDDVLSEMKRDDIMEFLGETTEPDDVFTREELEEWARENLNDPCDDPDGYEERARY